MHILYTAEVTAVGGRNGSARSSDGALDLQLAAPPTLGGKGHRPGANPEQLFAAGYAACFAGAMQYIAAQQKLDPGEITIDSRVSIGPDDATGAFTLAVAMHVTAPGIDQSAAERLVAQAHQACPYSRATRGNIEVQLTARGGAPSGTAEASAENSYGTPLGEHEYGP
jgi:osmotically inducible protein OsmC